MKLYNSKYAPNARRVRVFLAEKGLTIPLVDLDLGKLEQKTAGYAQINPFQLVPVLEFDDGDRIAKSIAICRYLEELNPEPNLFGRSARERAEVEMWQRQLELYLFMPIAQAYRHSHPAAKVLETQQVAEWSQINRARALENMAKVDAALANRPFIAGDRFTVADITGLVALDFTRPAQITIPEALSNLARWKSALSARPSAQT